jgi:transposase-like protein
MNHGRAEEAQETLEAVCAKWEERCPRAAQRWTRNWPRRSTFLRYPEPLRKLIHTTNIIEGYHPPHGAQGHPDQRVFDGDLAVPKLMYLVQQPIARETWQRPQLNWRSIYLSIEIHFEDRIDTQSKATNTL